MSEPRACAVCGVVKPPCCYEHGYRMKDACQPCASMANRRANDRSKHSPAGIASAKRAHAKRIASDNDGYAARVAAYMARKGAA